MAASGLALDARQGCPSGLAPPAGECARADPAAFVRRDAAGRETLELLVRGARCAGCIAKIERGLLSLPGVEEARLNLSTNRLTASWRAGALIGGDIVEAVRALGYDAIAFDPDTGKREADKEGRALLLRLAVAGFAAMNIMMFSVPVWSGAGEMGEAQRTYMHWISAAIAFPTTLYAGQPFFRSAWAALRRGRANMDVPISLAVILTLGISLYETIARGAHAYFDGVAMLLFLLLIGRYLDHKLRAEAGAAARDLLALQAATATRVEPNGDLRAIAVRDIRAGDLISLSPGDRAPVDGVIVEGASDIDLAILTGETTPAPMRVGDTLAAGGVNLTQRLIVRATSRAADSTVAQLARLVEIGEQGRAKYRRIADKAAALYIPVVHTLAAATFIGWIVAPLIAHLLGFDLAAIGVRGALSNAVAVLIITCPCALGLAAPAVQIVATGRLFRQGVLIKSGDALERLAQADIVLLDKTGTLTLGRPRLVSGHAQAELLLAASLARASRHPLSRAIVEAAGPGAAAAKVIERPGQGLEAIIGARRVQLGSAAFVGAPESAHAAPELWLRADHEAPVRFRFDDTLRADAREAIAALTARGLDVELLSGDREEAAASAARAAGISSWRSRMRPEDKVLRIAELVKQGRKVFMVGDGLNDAAALAAAHVSASPGAAIAAAQAAADIVFQGERLTPLVDAIDVARAARSRMLENFAFAALYNAVTIPIAVLGLVTPLIAALAMSGSSLIVTLNAARLARRA
ncbi:MAG: heavy metal translocating P-type ATPase [Hyphomonadaceae bacterium]